MNIFITGATGFLGGELLVDLSKRKEIDKIYCLIRARNIEESGNRLKKIFALHKDYLDANKVIPILGDLTNPELVIELESNPLLKDVHVVLHSAANTSFSPIYNDIIEKVNIHGLERILLWSKGLKSLKTFIYVGTATICGEGISNRVIMEDESPDHNSKHFVRYTYTKMQGELLLPKYLPDEKILIVRPSIIMGDTREWVPRSYVILWALAACNLMRLVPVFADSNLDIIPVDYAAKAINELLLAKRKYNIYHISSGNASCTTPRKATSAIENSFPDKPPFKFVDFELISHMKFWAKGRLNPESELLDHSDYLDYLEKAFGDKQTLRILFAGLEPYLKFIELGQIFDNSRLLEDTNVGNPEPAHEYIKRSFKYLENIDVFEGALDP